METEDLRISCPLCGNQHSYKLQISRTTIAYAFGEYGPWYDREFTRLFSCPNKHQKFEATFVLAESREYMINEVQIQASDTSEATPERGAS